MEIQELKSFIADPIHLKEDDFIKIQDLLNKYPFFHTAQLLFVKAAHNTNIEIYNTQIQKISASVPNREILHDLINLKEVVKTIEVKNEEKKEESQTRKNIREKIDQRRRKRQVDKGDALNQNGKTKHLSIIDNFFKPIFEILVNELDNYSVKVKKPNIIDAEQETQQDFQAVSTEITEEREFKRIEREKRMAEKRKLREEQNSEQDPEQKRLERERRKEERLKFRENKSDVTEENINQISQTDENSEHPKTIIETQLKTENDNLIIIEAEIPEANKLKPKKKSETTDDENVLIKDTDPFTKIITLSNDTKSDLKPDYKEKPNIIIEEINTITENKKEEEVNVIENIYDKIIGSKKSDSQNINTEIEINKFETQQFTQENNSIEIETETKTIQSQSSENEIEFIIDKPSEPINVKDISETSNNIESTEIQNDIIEFIDESKTESKTEDIEITFNKPDNKDKEILENKSQTEEIILEKVQDKVEPEPTKQKIIHQQQTDVKTKAADDVFARIEALKNKMHSQNHQEIKTEQINPTENEDLIQKFVEEKPSLKREDIEKTDTKDISETSNNIESTEILNDIIEFIDESKTESKTEDIEITFNKPDNKDKEILENKSQTEEIILEKVQDKVEPEPTKQKIIHQQQTDVKTKAADDVFARIEALKNKMHSQNHQEIKTEQINPTENEDLIQKFVEEKPSLKREDIEKTDTKDISEESIKIKTPVVTELMASIFINQGKYDQAIEIFEKLILKNPEKKDYFASKIEETKKLN